MNPVDIGKYPVSVEYSSKWFVAERKRRSIEQGPPFPLALTIFSSQSDRMLTKS